MNGFLNLLKPPGMTSHDVVSAVRRTLQTKSVGHTGTLDPAAAGVLVLTVGEYTRLGEYLIEGDKRYRAEITLGATTDSADVDGVVIAEASAAAVTQELVRVALAGLTGTISMRPPALSAVRVNGKRLYELARAGKPVDAPVRIVQVDELTLLAFTPGERARALVDVTCSKGTYIRSLAVMLGERLGCGGHLSLLIRTGVGDHRLDGANTFEELARDPAGCLLTARQALPHLPETLVGHEPAEALRHGQAVPAQECLPPGPALVYNAPDSLLCLAEVIAGTPVMLQPRKVFAQ